MISSEVQRTLVKSPPELWAEVSSPEGLARHLGELGEIRITATEPESRVEWQAGGTTGTVLIKPSGWGTKVTLSVTREIDLPASADQTATEPDEAAPAPSPADDEVPADEHALATDTQHAAAAESAVAGAESAVAGAESAASDEEPDAGAGLAPARPACPGPAQEPDEPALAEPAQEQQGPLPTEQAHQTHELQHDPRAGDAPAGEILLRPHTVAGRWEAHATSHQEAAAPERSSALAQWSAQVGPAPEAGAPSEAEDGGTSVDREAEQSRQAGRPGFFARLFRRGRAAPAEEPVAAVAVTEQTPPDPAGADEPEAADEAAQDLPPELAPASQTSSGVEAAAEEEVPVHPTEPAPAADAGSSPEAAQPVASVEPVAPAGSSAGCEEAQTAEPAPADLDAGGEEAADGAQPADGVQAAGGAQHLDVTQPDDGADAGEPELESAGADISAELKAAEEAATAEVTAVLTAALDSLGAAHHRPFSRA